MAGFNGQWSSNQLKLSNLKITSPCQPVELAWTAFQNDFELTYFANKSDEGYSQLLITIADGEQPFTHSKDLVIHSGAVMKSQIWTIVILFDLYNFHLQGHVAFNSEGDRIALTQIEQMIGMTIKTNLISVLLAAEQEQNTDPLCYEQTSISYVYFVFNICHSQMRSVSSRALWYMKLYEKHVKLLQLDREHSQPLTLMLDCFEFSPRRAEHS